jgi:hypothetical protein
MGRVMTNEEIIVIADCILRAEAGEVDQATLDAETEKVTRAEDHVALNLACKILSGRPYTVCTDVPVIWVRASSMADYLNASYKQMQIDIGDGEFLVADVYRPAAPREADKPYKRITVSREGLAPLEGTQFVRGGIITVTSKDGRQKSTQVGGMQPDVLGTILLRELRDGTEN